MKSIYLMQTGSKIPEDCELLFSAEIVDGYQTVKIPALGRKMTELLSLAETVEKLSFPEIERMTRLGDRLRRQIVRELAQTDASVIAVVGARPVLMEIVHSWCSFISSPLEEIFFNLPFDVFPFCLLVDEKDKFKTVKAKF